jgi:hypothetical protein
MPSEFFKTIWSLPRSMRAVVQSTFNLSSSAIESTSPFTGQSVPYGPMVQVFVADLKPPPAPGPAQAREGQASWREWQGFITRIRGTSGRLRITDYFRMRPAYDMLHAATAAQWADGEIWMNGEPWTVGALPPYVTFDQAAAAGDDNFVLRGLPANTEAVLAPADLIEGRPNGIPTDTGNLYEVVHISRTNADGKARVYVQPPLRQGFAAGDMAVLRYPTSVFRLADKDQGIVTRGMGNIGNLGLRLIEDVDMEEAVNG